METNDPIWPPSGPLPAWPKFVIIGVLLWWGTMIVYPILFPPTAEEKLAAQAEWRAGEAARKLENDRSFRQSQHRAYLESMCYQKKTCGKYAVARQECATAGNFSNCILVKLGDEDGNTIDQCTNDGKLVNPPPDMLNAVECWGVNFTHKGQN